MTARERASTSPSYNLDHAGLEALEAELVDVVRPGTSDEGIAAVWLGPDHPYANIVRTHEGRLFPEVRESSADDEGKTLFLALVDTRAGSSRVVHGATVCGAGPRDGGSVVTSDMSTGFISIDNLIDLDNFSPYEFESYYTARNIDLIRCLSVETNFRIGHRVPDVCGVSTSSIAYLMVFRLLVRCGARPNRSLVFADVNRAARISLQRNGIMYEPLMGRTDLVSPEAALGRSSCPVALPADNALYDVFSTMRVEVPEVFFGAQAVLVGQRSGAVHAAFGKEAHVGSGASTEMTVGRST